MARCAPNIINLQLAIEVEKLRLFKQLKIKRVADAKLRWSQSTQAEELNNHDP